MKNHTRSPKLTAKAAIASVVVVMVGSLLAISPSPAGAQEPTSVTLVADPAGSAVAGTDVLLTATVSPSDAQGVVEFSDLNGPWKFVGPDGLPWVNVVDGQASIVASGLSVGSHGFQAKFVPSNEAYLSSLSPELDYEITLGDYPVIDCVGADDVSHGLLLIAAPQTGGQITVVTPVEADVPETLPLGGSAQVSFTWNFVLPPNLANVAITTGAEFIDLVDMGIAVDATGAAEGHFGFPETFRVEDFFEPILLEASGTVHVTDEGEISYDMASPTTLTVEVPPNLVTPEGAVVALACEFLNGNVATTVIEGELNPPGPPSSVIATPAGLQASLSWDAPEDNGGSSITGYAITSNPAGVELTTAPNVTSIDVIGLSADTAYTFEVQAVNEVGAGEPGISNEVTIDAASASFSDVPSSHPFYSEITWMAETGLSTGYPGNLYQPNLTLTRQAMSAFIYRINGSPNGDDPTCSSAPFNDVPADHPFCGEIAWMKDTGISTGYEGNLYQPDLGLTRQAMSAFLYRSGNPGVTPTPCSTPPFPDVPTTNPFCAEIAWMADTGISEGFDDGARYEPNLDLTRQAMSAFLYRYTLVVPTEL